MKTDFFPKALPLVLAAMALVLTGCPHNDYTVELKPAGPAMMRTLTFYRADGVNTNTGLPDYRTFDPAEMAAIAGLYPTNSLTHHGDVHTVKGEFGNQMPNDVGGAGVYTNIATTLGCAGFYVERFRGNDDLEGLMESRRKAADQLTDLLIGWSRVELKHEKGYPQLHAFLDGNLRHDLKSASDYYWEWQMIGDRETNAAGEYIARVCQYFYDRGYFKIEETPRLAIMLNENNNREQLAWLQRFVARKMGVPDGEAVPALLDFLASDEAMEKSFTNYFGRTVWYETALQDWKREHGSDAGSNQPAPDPRSIGSEYFWKLIEVGAGLGGGVPDHLTVKLGLPSAPLHSNGLWDGTNAEVVWSSDVESGTNMNHLPFLCYATWAGMNEAFQTNHFGKVAVSGDDLVQYCLWRCSQDTQRGGEWDAFLAGLKPEDDIRAKVSAFRFAGETEAQATNYSVGSSLIPRELLEAVSK